MESPKATLYVWAKLPAGFSDSLEFSHWLVNEAGVWITPGVFFGKGGSQYVRATLTLPDERLQEAVDRIVAAMKNR